MVAIKTIGMTESMIKAIGRKAVKDIPVAHNRVREEVGNRAMLNLCEQMGGRTVELRAGDIIAVRRRKNLGTKKWAQMIDTVEFATVTRVCNEITYFTTCKYLDTKERCDHRNVLAVIRQ